MDRDSYLVSCLFVVAPPSCSPAFPASFCCLCTPPFIGSPSFTHCPQNRSSSYAATTLGSIRAEDLMEMRRDSLRSLPVAITTSFRSCVWGLLDLTALFAESYSICLVQVRILSSWILFTALAAQRYCLGSSEC